MFTICSWISVTSIICCLLYTVSLRGHYSGIIGKHSPCLSDIAVVLLMCCYVSLDTLIAAAVAVSNNAVIFGYFIGTIYCDIRGI